MRVPVSAFLMLASVALAAPALAHDAAADGAARALVRHPLQSWRPVAWRPAPAAAAGMRAELDPQTGELVTPARTRLPLETALRAAREAGLTVVTRPDGSRRVVVGDRLRKWSVASVAADGSLRHECVASEAAAVGRARERAADSAPQGGR